MRSCLRRLSHLRRRVKSTTPRFCSHNRRGCCHLLAPCCMKHESLRNVFSSKTMGMKQNDNFRQVTAVREICNLSAVHSYRYQHAGILTNSAANTDMPKHAGCDLCAVLGGPVHGSPVWGIRPPFLVHIGGQLHLPGTVPLPSCISLCSLGRIHRLDREQLKCNQVSHMCNLSTETHLVNNKARAVSQDSSWCSRSGITT